MKGVLGKKRKYGVIKEYNEDEDKNIVKEDKVHKRKVKITRSIMSDEEDIIKYKGSDDDDEEEQQQQQSDIHVQKKEDNSEHSRSEGDNDSKSESNNNDDDDDDVLNQDIILFPNVVEIHSTNKNHHHNKSTHNTSNNNTTNKNDNYQIISTQNKIQPWQQHPNCISLKHQGMLKLHYEIFEFYEYMKLTPHETQLREDTITFLEKTITSSFPSFTLSKYGSFLTDLSLPDSDIDIVIIPPSSQQPTTPDSADKLLQKITTLLLSTNQFTYIEIIKARVPIIKATYKPTNINIDISLYKPGFENQKQILIEILNEYPHMRQLIYILKYFIRQKKLNDLHSGGISSYILFHMVYFYLLNVYKNKHNSHSHDLLTLGHLLIGFFQFYAFDINYDKVGISVRYGGFFYDREKKSYGAATNNNNNNNNSNSNKGNNVSKGKHILSFENCVDIDKDLGKYCFKYIKVVDCFKMARDALYYPSEYPIKSWLGMLIHEDDLIKNRNNK